MRLTRLRLNGFKSFVDPTEVVIREGLTGIVGPNGCGKSNLLEALRWVMGENRPTAMRGEGMEDVIFAGAASRAARHFAEVAITIDNSERLAPAGFNDEDVLEITRRITRDAGSAYRANGREMRARDVQMLFADASTGAHSPALVRQGQISELINARPKSRRRVLEEAAGISGLYQRRHEAELKLQAAEANLTRVDDVIEGLSQQLQGLARQARQAARYREIGEELRRAEGMLLYRRWREADAARAAAAAELQERLRAAARAEAGARAASAARQAAEAALPPAREEEAIAAALLQRLRVERDGLRAEAERARGAIAELEARIEELDRDRDREAALDRDAAETVLRLAAEAEALAAAGEGHEARLAAAAAAAAEAAAVLSAAEAALSQLTEDVARLSARHQSAERMLADSRTVLARGEAAAEAARQAARQAEDALGAAAAAMQAAAARLEAAQRRAAEAEAGLAAADEARTEAQARETEARAARAAAEGEAGALRAEVAALTRLVEREAQAGEQLLDRVTVRAGFEKALGAALADDLRAPEVGAGRSTGWARLPAYGTPQPLPPGVRPLAEVVEVPAVLARRLGQIGLVGRDEGARLQAALLPGQRLVSAEGDLWRWDGFRAAAEDAPSASALRLQQLNRLVELKRDLEAATARAAGAAQAHDLLSRRLAQASEADRLAREARKVADGALAEASRALSRAEAERSIAGGQLETARMAEARHADEARAARERLGEAEAALKALPDLAAERARAEEMRAGVEAARTVMLGRRTAHDGLRRDGEARERRLSEIGREREDWARRQASAGARIAEIAARREEAAAALAAARAAPEAIAARAAMLEEGLAGAGARQAAAADRLSAAEAALREAAQAEREAERAASDAREARARAEALADAAAAAAEEAAARIAEEADATPGGLLERLAADPAQMPAAEALEAEVGRLRRQREALGAVNLRAEEDARAVQAEHDTLVAEKADLEEAIRKLRAGIQGLNREGRERLLTAFEQVNGNFAMLFRHLFGGGEAQLALVESDDPLEAGLEILCQPPGKKLSTLSLLSGGEQTLTALALIFAVFLANPAPICVLDEVDAPLDDANVTRFCDLLDEMTRRTDTRFLIITHHAVTMSRMDRLFGVTMQEPGVSQLVSVDLRRAEQLVA
ncbi:MAG: AAA family ATPase [Rhodobacteraceae bacterium]|nr:AAA family ATPase [Paracoccaceae bacterium]